MTGAPDLTGKTVLLVEDDYYVLHCEKSSRR